MGNIFVLCLPSGQTDIGPDDSSISNRAQKQPQKQQSMNSDNSQQPIFSVDKAHATESQNLMNVEEAIGVKPVVASPSKYVEKKKAHVFFDLRPQQIVIKCYLRDRWKKMFEKCRFPDLP